MPQRGEHLALAFHVGNHETRISSLERDMTAIKYWGMRTAVLVVLWLVAMASNMGAERAAALIVELLKKL